MIKQESEMILVKECGDRKRRQNGEDAQGVLVIGKRTADTIE